MEPDEAGAGIHFTPPARCATLVGDLQPRRGVNEPIERRGDGA